MKNFSNMYSFLIASLLALPAISQATSQTPETWLTVFVHGIMSIKPHLSVSNFIRFMGDNVHNTVYSKTVEIMRNDPIFFQNQAMQEIGLKEVDPYTVAKGNASSATALVFEQMNAFAFRNAPITNHYYTFGWSGLMSQKRRYYDAVELYKAIGKEIARFKKMGITPKIRMIGYSHGGNTLLNLAQARQRNPDLPTFTVNELILLGMPVQSETDFMINDPIFERIYHIYSRGDRIQKLDFFSVKRFFSRRLFKKRRGFKIPDKLIQIQLKCTRTARFTPKHHKQVDLYNFHSHGIIGGKSKYLRDASPGHTELWFFGWTPGNYRKNFPLYPLPASALIPLILREARNFEGKEWFEKPTLIDIRPEQEVVLVRNQKSKKMIKISQFLPHSELDRLEEQVMLYKPDNYTQERYDGAIHDAYNQAVEFRRQFTKSKRANRKAAARQRRLAKHRAHAQ